MAARKAAIVTTTSPVLIAAMGAPEAT
jgi:hypothetical protein